MSRISSASHEKTCLARRKRQSIAKVAAQRLSLREFPPQFFFVCVFSRVLHFSSREFNLYSVLLAAVRASESDHIHSRKGVYTDVAM